MFSVPHHSQENMIARSCDVLQHLRNAVGLALCWPKVLTLYWSSSSGGNITNVCLTPLELLHAALERPSLSLRLSTTYLHPMLFSGSTLFCFIFLQAVGVCKPNSDVSRSIMFQHGVPPTEELKRQKNAYWLRILVWRLRCRYSAYQDLD